MTTRGMPRLLTPGAFVALISGLALAGCSCGDPGATPPDAGMPPLPAADAGPGLPVIDAGDVFSVPDASSAAPACEVIERTSTRLPPLEPGQVVVRAHEDRLLVIERPNSPPEPSTTIFRYWTARLGEPFELVAEHGFGRNVGMVLEARWRDGAWDVLIDLFSHEGLVAWVRVGEDGAVSATEHRGPTDARLDVGEAFSAGDDFLLVAFEESEGSRRGAPWIARVPPPPEGVAEALPLTFPSGADGSFQVVARPSRAEIVLFASDPRIPSPPRVALLPVAPLRLPAESEWRELEGPYESGMQLSARLDDAGGLVLGEFLRASGGPYELRLSWLDASFRTLATWSVETEVAGHVRVAGSPPAQEIFVTLPDRGSEPDGLATVFHARASAPGVVSALSPIGRTRGFRPPEIFIGADGLARALHFDDRIDVERVCEVP